MQRFSKYGLGVSAALFLSAGFVHFRPTERITVNNSVSSAASESIAGFVPMGRERDLFAQGFLSQPVLLPQGRVPVRDSISTLFTQARVYYRIDPAVKGDVELPRQSMVASFQFALLDVLNRASKPLELGMEKGYYVVRPAKKRVFIKEIPLPTNGLRPMAAAPKAELH